MPASAAVGSFQNGRHVALFDENNAVLIALFRGLRVLLHNCPILARIILCLCATLNTAVISGNGHAYRGLVINYNEPFWEQKPASCRSSSRDSI